MRKHLITLAALAGGFIVGASALVALAQTGGWTPAPGTPPTPNALAPINVGSIWQYKTGSLTIGTNSSVSPQPALDVVGGGLFDNLGITGSLIVSAGASTTANSVLTNNGSGVASWVTPAAAVLHGMIIYTATPSNNTWTAPQGVTSVYVRAQAGNTDSVQGSTLSLGEYAESVLPVTPGITYGIIVGQSGVTGTGNCSDSQFGIKSSGHGPFLSSILLDTTCSGSMSGAPGQLTGPGIYSGPMVSIDY